MPDKYIKQMIQHLPWRNNYYTCCVWEVTREKTETVDWMFKIECMNCIMPKIIRGMMYFVHNKMAQDQSYIKVLLNL